MSMKKGTIVRHHLLECMFYIDENGNKIIIHNSRERLKELGIYDDYKMCIEITQSEHVRLHNANMSDETRAKISKGQTGKNNYLYGKTLSDETKKKMSEKSALRIKALEYKDYKANGGQLMWHDWLHEKSIKLKEQWQKYHDEGGTLGYKRWYNLKFGKK